MNYATIGAHIAGDRVSEHISRAEYECQGSHELPPDLYMFHDMYQELFDVFEHIRRRWQEPPYPGGGITVTSGYRTKAHNIAVKGASLSTHLFGLALDLLMNDKRDADSLQGIVERDRGDVRIGRYISKPGLVHIDVAYIIRPRADKSWVRGARWINP